MIARATGGFALLAAVAGGVVLAFGGFTAMLIGGALLGLAAIAVVSLIFLLVGEGEDRDRTRHPRG